MIFYDFYEKKSKSNLPWGLKIRNQLFASKYFFSSKTRKLRDGTPMEEPGTLSFGPLAQECQEGPGPNILIDILYIYTRIHLLFFSLHRQLYIYIYIYIYIMYTCTYYFSTFGISLSLSLSIYIYRLATRLRLWLT